jgi:hypothetical protein
VTSESNHRRIKAMGAALAVIGLVTSCYGLYFQFISARLNNAGRFRNADGSSDGFGTFDAAINLVPMGITVLVAIGISIALALRNFYAAAFLAVAQMTWLFAFAPGAWIN